MAVSISLSITQNSQSIANNTSNVTVKVTAKWTYGSYNLNKKSGWVKIDGTKYSFTSAFNTGQSTSGSTTLYTKTVNVSHATNGTKTLSCSASYTSGVSSGTVTASKSKTLTTIPRKSSISAVTASALGSASTISVTRQSTSFTHTITYTCGSASGTICTKSTATSVPWTPPISLASQNTAGSSLTVKFTIETFNGSTSLGTNTWTSYAYTIPLEHEDIKPGLSLDVADVYSYRATYGAYVQGKSQLQITMTPEFKMEASAKSYKTTIDGKTYTVGPSLTTDIITGSGDMTITVVLTDTRGGTVTKTWDISVLEYATPKLVSSTIKRSESDGTASSSGAYLTVTFSSAVSPLDNKNTAAYTIQYKKTSETSYSDPIPLSSYANNYAVSNGVYTFAADTASTYDVILAVADGIEDDDKTLTGSSISKVWSILARGTGFAFGKVAEIANTLEVAWNAKFNEKVTLSNNKFLFSEDTNGNESMMIGMNTSNNILVGWDIYDQALGNTVLYGNQVRVNAKNGVYINNKALWETIYPVGAVYISYASTSPAELFGGSWTAITGVFPYFNAGTATGGSNTHTLTIAQMPSHNHSGYVKITGSKLASGSTYSRLNDNGGNSQDLVINNTGGGGSHNNMPAYQTFYAWRRTA